MEKEMLKLKVQMLGGFSMTLGDEPLSFSRNSTTKAMKLLQILLYHSKQGISRKTLIEYLYGREDMADAANSLRVTVHRMKKMLTDMGLPKHNYVRISKGVYQWDAPVETVLDVFCFENILEGIMAEDWYRVDNVAKVFLAAHNNRDTRVMRVSATLNEEIDEKLLNEALGITIKSRPEFQVRIRRGFFWHYMEQTDHIPVAVKESGRPCPVLYGRNFRGVLHYKVTYYEKRINIDIFHAIADGTGALSFLKLLVLNYLRLSHPGELNDLVVDSATSVDDRYKNSFVQFCEKTERAIPKRILNKKSKAYHIQSGKLPFDQLQFMEVHMPASGVLSKAKELQVSMTSFLGATLMMAINADRPYMQRSKPITISLPVNLRNYYPSDTMRNFFNNVDVTHVFDGSETIESLAREFDTVFKEKLTPEKIQEQMDRYQSIERIGLTRITPLAIKQIVVKAFQKSEDGRVTAVLSNLGRLELPEEMRPYVKEVSDFCATNKLFITITSLDDDLVLGIANAYTNTGVISRFISGIRPDEGDVILHCTEVYR